MAGEKAGLAKRLWKHRGLVGLGAVGLTIAVLFAGNNDPTTEAAPAVATASASPESPDTILPAFDAAAGAYNKARRLGVVTCAVQVSRQGDALTAQATLAPQPRGVWFTYSVNSHEGSIKGADTDGTITIANHDQVFDGSLAQLSVVGHYPNGDRNRIVECPKVDIPKTAQ